MDYDNQKALKILYELRTELQKSDETAKLKQLNQIISVLESSFFRKIVGIHKSLEALKKQKNLNSEDIQVDAENGTIKFERTANNFSKNSLENQSISKAPKQLPLSQDEFNKRIKILCGTRELLHIQINKDNITQTLGFSIKCSGSLHVNGIFIEDVTPGALGDRSGIKPSDQIIAVDGIPLDDPDSNKDVALQALKNSHMRIDLYIARDQFRNHLTPAKEHGHVRNRSDVIFTQELDTEWTQYEIIDLKCFNGSFGFGIMGGLTREVMVRNILPEGSADWDGRLQLDDHIMYINNIPVRQLSSNQVADILKNQTTEVKLIVARPFNQTSTLPSSGKVQMVETSDLDARLQMIVNQLYPENATHDNFDSISEQEPSTTSKQNNSSKNASDKDNEDVTEFIQVDLIQPEKTLGFTLITLSNKNNLDGIYVSNVLPGSVAEKYNIKKYDRVVKVNDENIDVKKLETSVNFILNFSPMSFTFLRYISGPSHEKLMQMDDFVTLSTIPSNPHNNINVQNLNTPLLFDSSDESIESDSDLKDHLHHQRKPLTLKEKLQLISKWKKRIDGNREIIIAEFSKFTEDGGLGISLEGTVDVEDNGLEVHPHHYIRSIIPNGPAGRNGFLRVKDELLEANDKRIYGLNHLDAVNVLKNLPLSVRIVVARSVVVTSNFFVGDEVSVEADRLCQDLDDIIARETGSGSLFSVKAKSQDYIDDWPLTEGKLSDEVSRSRSLDQVQGLAIWDRQITYIDLEKRANGLGFSVIDYQDPVDPQQSVIVIRSLVPNGAASKDGRIIPGDRLMSVNEIDVSRANMLETVDVLKKTEPGIVRLGIVKALSLESDNYHQNLTINESNVYENVSSPRLNDEYESELNAVDSFSVPVPEALEHKIRIHKLVGQKLGIQLESEKPFSNNENGYVIKTIDNGSPAQKCNRLNVGDFVTKIDDISIREATLEEVNAILKRIITCSEDIKINFIPESDYQVFMQSRTMQSHFRQNHKNQINYKVETEQEFVGFFSKPSVVKASGGKLIFKTVDNAEKIVLNEKENTEIEINEKENSNIIQPKPRSRVSSLVELYDGIYGAEVNVNLERLPDGKFGIEIVG